MARAKREQEEAERKEEQKSMELIKKLQVWGNLCVAYNQMPDNGECIFLFPPNILVWVYILANNSQLPTR